MSDFSKSKLTRSDNYATPEDLMKALDDEFHFNDDPCPMLHDNSELFLDGLAKEWGTSTFINPPYSRPEPFCRKAYEESLKGKLVVALLRGDTSTKWFHKWVLGEPIRKHFEETGIWDWSLAYAKIRFLKGRLYFNKKPAPFNSIIVIWGNNGD